MGRPVQTAAQRESQRKAILDAVGIVAEQQGYAHITFASVARVAHMSRGTVYKHFETISDMTETWLYERTTMDRETIQSTLAALGIYSR